MKKLLGMFFVSTVLLPFSIAVSQASGVITQKMQQAMTPSQALCRLQQGNQRFVSNQRKHFDLPSAIHKTATKGQHPFAMLLACMDSRSSPDLTFDQSLGNIFVGRVAGNVVGKAQLGSMEFAAQVVGVKLIVVMGHTQCGAIQGACMGAGEDNLRYLLSKMNTAVSSVKKTTPNFNCNTETVLTAITKKNVLDQMHGIMKHSPGVAAMVKKGQVKLVGAMHNLLTGKVTFFDIKGQAISGC